MTVHDNDTICCKQVIQTHNKLHNSVYNNIDARMCIIYYQCQNKIDIHALFGPYNAVTSQTVVEENNNLSSSLQLQYMYVTDTRLNPN